MKHRSLFLAAIALSWIASASLGGLLALHFARLNILPSSTLRTRGLEIVDARGTTRLTLGTEQDEPSIRLLSPQGVPFLRLAVDRTPPSSAGQGSPYLLSKIELNDGEGHPAIELNSGHKQRGILAFSAPNFEGKVLLGHFGITDDGTDTGLWGLQVSSAAGGMHTGRMLGVMTSNGSDTKLVWPLYAPPDKVK